jgi:hypothetical protein
MLPFKNFIKEEALKFQPPAGAVAAAKKAIEWKEKYPNEVKAMTRTGWVRARQLANGDKISYDILKRMSAFNRHRKNSTINPEKKDRPWRDNGYVAWLGWGGDAGVDWAMKMSKKTREAEKAAKGILEGQKELLDEAAPKTINVPVGAKMQECKYNKKSDIWEATNKKSLVVKDGGKYAVVDVEDKYRSGTFYIFKASGKHYMINQAEIKEAKTLLEKTELAGWEDGGTYANSKFKILEFIGPDELESKLGTRKCLEIEKISESRSSDSVQKTFMSLNANDVNELREFLEDYSTEKDEPNVK